MLGYWHVRLRKFDELSTPNYPVVYKDDLKSHKIGARVDKEKVSKFFASHKKNFFDEWYEFLRFRSVSTDPNYRTECIDCAQWLGEKLSSKGFKARVQQTTTLPLVVGTLSGDSNLPHILVYGHYDVQPPDPLDEWISPPFEPTQREDRLYARGAVDNKGQLWMTLSALEACYALGSLRNPVTVLIEGEEECGSTGLAEILRNNSLGITADVLLVCDLSAPEPKIPCIVLGFRGVFSLELTVSGAKSDLHSGLHGGLAPNPLVGLAKIIAGCFSDKGGDVLVPGFYDDISPLSELEESFLTEMKFSSSAYEEEIGVPPIWGEKGVPPLVRCGLRPTLEITGMHGGYTGKGQKAIIPKMATAKILGRSARGQSPAKMLELVEKYLLSFISSGLNASVSNRLIAGSAVTIDPSEKPLVIAKQVACDLLNRPPNYEWSGGSIPIIGDLSFATGAMPLLLGFSLAKDGMHSPNESFSFSQFEAGFEYITHLLVKFGEYDRISLL